MKYFIIFILLSFVSQAQWVDSLHVRRDTIPPRKLNEYCVERGHLMTHKRILHVSSKPFTYFKDEETRTLELEQITRSSTIREQCWRCGMHTSCFEVRLRYRVVWQKPDTLK